MSRPQQPVPPPADPGLLGRQKTTPAPQRQSLLSTPMSSYTSAPNIQTGMYFPGNIDLNQRIGQFGTAQTNNANLLLSRNPLPKDNLWEGQSTVYSSSFTDEHGRNVLIPTVIPDTARGGWYIASFPEAVNHYYRTGEHLGMFATPEDADKYAQALHEDLAARGGHLRPEEIINKMQRIPTRKR